MALISDKKMLTSDDNMGFYGELDFLPVSFKEAKVEVPQPESERVVEDDYSDDEIDVDELEKRLWRDKMRLKRLKEEMNKECKLKEMNKEGKEGLNAAKQRQSEEQARRKKIRRVQDGILKSVRRRKKFC